MGQVFKFFNGYPRFLYIVKKISKNGNMFLNTEKISYFQKLFSKYSNVGNPQKTRPKPGPNPLITLPIYGSGFALKSGPNPTLSAAYLRLRQANLKGDQGLSDSEDDELTDSTTDSTSSATSPDELYRSHSSDTAGSSAEHEDSDGRSNASEETSADQIAHSKAQGTKGERSSSHVRRKRNARSLNGYYVWSRLLEKYSKTTITFPTDRLVALSGLAQIMSEALEDEYVAGLWKSILPSQLLWRVGQFTPGSILDVGE